MIDAPSTRQVAGGVGRPPPSRHPRSSRRLPRPRIPPQADRDPARRQPRRPGRRDGRPRRRVRIRQVHSRARRARSRARHWRNNQPRRRRHRPRLSHAATRTRGRPAGHLPGSLLFAQPVADRRRHPGRAVARPRGRLEGCCPPGARPPRPCSPADGCRAPPAPGVQRRSAPTRRDRAGDCARTATDRLRRTGLGAGPDHAGAHPRAAPRGAGTDRRRLPLRLARSECRPRSLPPGRGDARRRDRGVGRRGRGDLEAGPSLHPTSAAGVARRRPGSSRPNDARCCNPRPLTHATVAPPLKESA